MVIDTNIYRKFDGSPFGNGHVNKLIFGGLETCTKEKCLGFGWHWKCYHDYFPTCFTYIKRSILEKIGLI